MSSDTMRLHYTYGIAVLVLVGAFVLLFFETPGITGGEKLAFIAGLTTGVIGFVFNRETAVGEARKTERAIAQGAAQAGTTVNNAENVESGGPTNVSAGGPAGAKPLT